MSARLDDPGFVLKNDPKGMMGLTLGFPEQCRKALDIAERASLPKSAAGKQHVVVAGVGGSAAGGDFLSALFDNYGEVPCMVCRDYNLPAFVGESTLVFACSYSGNTEETLSAAREAIKRGCTVIGVTSGGELAALCNSGGFPIITIPSGQPPRTALGYLFVPLAVAGVRLAYLPEPDFGAAFEQLERCREEWRTEARSDRNPTKPLAEGLFGRLPIIYGLGIWQGAVARRWKAQINENAKVMAFAHAFPELNHNEIMGWTLADRQNVRHWATVVLQNGHERPEMKTRLEVTIEIIRGKTEAFDVTARGNTLLEQMLTLTYFGDFVSLYLAALYEIDPEPIAAINTLKQALAKSR